MVASPRGTKPLNLKTTRALRDQIERAAQRSGRSMSAEVEHRLENSTDRDAVLAMFLGGGENIRFFHDFVSVLDETGWGWLSESKKRPAISKKAEKAIEAECRRRELGAVIDRDDERVAPLNMRITPELRETLRTAAADARRNMTEEIEARLELSFLQDRVTAILLRAGEQGEILKRISDCLHDTGADWGGTENREQVHSLRGKLKAIFHPD